jgi:hypothetical protein
MQDEINVAVLGCTATLLFAFVPLLNLPEGAGDVTRSLPMAVVCTIAASLFVALTVIPFLASRILPRHGHSNVFLDVVMGGIHAVYRPILKVALGAPRITVIVGLALFAASLTLVPKLGFSLFPENDSPYFMVEVKLPDLVLRDLSSKGGVDVLASEVSGVVIGAVMKSVIAANIEGIGSDVLGGMQGAVEGIGGVIGGSLRGAVDVGVAGAGAALDAVGKGLGDIGKGAGKLMEGAGGALKDGVKGVGDALEGVFGGKK